MLCILTAARLVLAQTLENKNGNHQKKSSGSRRKQCALIALTAYQKSSARCPSAVEVCRSVAHYGAEELSVWNTDYDDLTLTKFFFLLLSISDIFIVTQPFPFLKKYYIEMY